GRGSPGHRPGLPHRATAQRAGASLHHARHVRGAHQRDDPLEARAGGNGRANRRDLGGPVAARGVEGAVSSGMTWVVGHLASTPFSFRKAGSSSLRRELIIPFGSSGYAALCEIEPEKERVIVLAVRHQLEDNYD